MGVVCENTPEYWAYPIRFLWN